MKLRTKVLVTGACATGVILALAYLVLHLVVLRAFTDLESRQVREHVARARAALDQQLAHLAISTEDWAAWDDTYVFAGDRNPDYVETNLVPDTLETLGIGAIAFIEPSGDIMALLEQEAEEAGGGLGAALVSTIWSDRDLSSRLSEESASGIVSLPMGPALVAAHPIVMSDHTGPSRGVVLFAKNMDNAEVALLSDVTRLPISIVRLGDQDDTWADAGAPPNGVSTEILDRRQIAGRTTIADLWGRPVAAMELILARDVYSQGARAVFVFFFALAAATVLPMCAAVLLGTKYIAGPVGDLCAFVDGVRRNGDLSARATPGGSPETASLGASINGMLAALQVSERERRSGEERFRSLVENLRDVVFTLDKDGVVTYTSPAIFSLLGRTPEEVLSRPLADLAHPEDRDAVVALVERAVAGESDQGECRMVCAGDDVRWALLSMRPQVGEDGVMGLHGIISDVTERRELESQLRQSQKMEAIGQLSEGIAHDFNNLLMVINGYTASALQAMDPRDPLREDILRVHRAGERGASLTRRLLTFGRQRLGTAQLIALGETIRHTSDMLRRMTGNAIRLELDLPESELYLQAEPGQIEQIIMNLALNARDAMPNGGTLTIVARQIAEPVPGQPGASGSSVVVEVRDTGQGMTPEVLQHAFEPFFTTKQPGKGTGLGLATIYGIVRQNRGAVSIDSAVGVGTTVTIRLPAASAPVARQRAEARGQALPRGTESVLLVEDQQEVRLLAQRMLQHMGYRVDASGNPADVLAIYDRMNRPYDLVLSDVAMPQMSGPEFVSRLRERGSSFAVVYMSGYTEDSVLRRGELRQNERFLQKPFTVEQLATVVRTALDGHPYRERRVEVV